jgi:hypothetical protein
LDVTFTVIVHEELAGTTPAESVSEAPPALADTVPEQPVPETAAEGDAVLTSPAG